MISIVPGTTTHTRTIYSRSRSANGVVIGQAVVCPGSLGPVASLAASCTTASDGMISLSVFSGVSASLTSPPNAETGIPKRTSASVAGPKPRRGTEPGAVVQLGDRKPGCARRVPHQRRCLGTEVATYTPLVYISPLDPNSTPRERFCTPRTRPHAALTPETWDTPPLSAQGLTTAPRERPAARRSLHVVSWWCRAARLLATVVTRR